MKKIILFSIALIFMVALGILSFYGVIRGTKYAYNIYLQNKYPLKYSESIIKYSTEFGLSPALVSAVTYEESRFRPESNSDKGAVGLMQLLPDTSDYIARKLNDKNYKKDFLNDVEQNIRYGCYYLSYLYKKYGDWDKTLAAYNAGEGNVDLWLKEGDYQVRFQETKNFVERVNFSKSMYEKLYFNK